MSASDEWTEWHLTPQGWIMGSERTDGPGVTEKEPPTDRVLTHCWHEYLGSAYGKMKRYSEKVWESDDKAAVKALMEKFGDPPRHL